MQFNEFQCSLFTSIDETRNGTTISIQKFLTDIENPSKPENEIINLYRLTGIKEKKKSLPLAVIHAITTRRKGHLIKELNGLMLFDLDDVESPEKLQQLKDYFRGDPHVLFFFESPSGKGLKVCYYTDILDRKLYTYAYKHMVKKFSEVELIKPYVDPVTSDLARGCWISYDPSVYRNHDVQQFALADDVQVERISRNKSLSSTIFCISILDGILNYYRKNNIEALDDYDEYIACGYALFTTLHWDEELAEDYFRELALLSPKFDPVDFDKTVASIKKNNQKKINLSTIIRKALERGFKTSYKLSDIDPSALSPVFFNVQRYPNALSVDKYLSELDLDDTKNLYLIAPTGIGKTEYFFKKLKGKRILLVPYISLAIHLANKYSTKANPVKAVYGKIVPTGDEEILIGTYNAIVKFNQFCDTRQYKLWIDECHNFITASNKNYRNEVMNRVARSFIYYKNTVAMTGTEIPNNVMFTKKDGFIKLVVQQRNRPPKRLCIVETDDIKTTIFRKIKEDSGRQHIIFYNNKERGEDLKEYFEKNGFKSQLFNSDVKDSKDSMELLETGKISKDVCALIVTSIFIEGLNVTEHNVGAIHLYEDATHTEIVQLASRTRENSPPIYLYVKRDELFYYDNFDFDAFCSDKISKAEAFCTVLNDEAKNPIGWLTPSDYEEELDVTRQVLRSTLLDSIQAPLGYFEVDELSVLNLAYERMRRSEYLDIKLLLYALVPYGFTFEVVPDGTVEEADRIKLRNQWFSKSQISQFIDMKQSNNKGEIECPFNERQLQKLNKRWDILSANINSLFVPVLMQKYGKSKQDMVSFQNKLRVQMFYAQRGVIPSTLNKDVPIRVDKFLANVHKAFPVDKDREYGAGEIMERLNQVKRSTRGYEDVQITPKTATAILRKVFQVSRSASNGQYYFTINSYDVTGGELDFGKINAGAPKAYDMEPA